MSDLESAVFRIASDLSALGRRGALVGGIAVSVRCEPRFTRDIDLAVAVANDAEAEALVFGLQGAGFRTHSVLENTSHARLATMRLTAPGTGQQLVIVDLLFPSCGIEAEIVADAEPLAVFPSVTLPVARAGHLIVMKLLARDDRRRPQDAADIRALLGVLDDEEIARARAGAALVVERGFSREKDLPKLLEEALRDRSMPVAEG